MGNADSNEEYNVMGDIYKPDAVAFINTFSYETKQRVNKILREYDLGTVDNQQDLEKTL